MALAQGATAAEVCRRLRVPDYTFYRWQQEYGGLKVDQTLKQVVAELTKGRQILKGAAPGNF